MPKDVEKRKGYDEKYEKSDRAKARKKRYREKHQTELTTKRKKQDEIKRQRRLEAFCRHFNLDVWNIRRLIKMHEAGRDIEAVDPHNAKYVFIWLSGKYPKNDYYKTTYRMVPGENQFSVPIQPVRNPSARSSDYY